MWNVQQQKLVHTFNGHQTKVNSVAFSPDSQYILSGSDDLLKFSNEKTLRLWSVEQKELIHTFNGDQKTVNSVAFSPNGKYLVSGSFNGTVKLWRGLDWQDWLIVGCERIRLHPALVSREIESAPDAVKTCLESAILILKKKKKMFSIKNREQNSKSFIFRKAMHN